MNAQADHFYSDSSEIKSISEIVNFPFISYAEFVSSIKTGYTTIGIEYSAARSLVNVIKSKSIFMIFQTTTWFPNIFIIISIALSLYVGNFYLLLGILFSFLGELFANPYNPLKKVFIVVSILAFFYLLYFRNIFEPIGWCCFTFALSYSTIMILNRLAWRWTYQAILTSELLAVNLFLSGNLHLKLEDGRYYSNRK